MRIADVQVTVNPNVQAHSDIASKVAASGRQAAAAYNAYMPADAPQHVVKISVDRVHYKNAALSLIVGDGNNISGVVSGGTAPASSVRYADVSSMAINGVIGAAIAIGTNKANTDTTLARGLADTAIAKAHGQKSVPQFVKRHMSGRPMDFSETPRVASQSAGRPVRQSRTVRTVEPNVIIADQRQSSASQRRYKGVPTPPPAGATY